MHLILAVVFALAALPLGAASRGGRLPVPLPLFPPNNWWNSDISQAPLDPNSAAFISFIGPTRGLHPDFGGDAGDGTIYGIPFIQVDGAQAKRAVDFYYPEQSDGVDHETGIAFPFYPIPDEAITQSGWIEGGRPGNVDAGGDRHILIVDTTNNHLYELYDMFHDGSGWTGGSGAFFDMNSNARRPEEWTSADAAGLAILPGLVRYDEMNDPGEIRHAFRVTVRATNGHVFPASHTAGDTNGALPMGARLRLKANKEISGFPPGVQKIFRAMKKYGLIVADNGSDMYISGAYDTRWDNDVLNPAFRALTAADFEVVQRGWHPPVTLVLTLPDPMGAGNPADATVTAYDANYQVATSYNGTIRFASGAAGVNLPADYTFTPGDAGRRTFPHGVTFSSPGTEIVRVSDVVQPVITGSAQVTIGPSAPHSLNAAADSSTEVGLSWTGSAGAAEYEVFRAASAGSFASIGTSASTVYTDTGVEAGKSYLYRVRAIDAASRRSPFSAIDVATTIQFLDDPLVPGVSVAKVAHFEQLRAAANAVRAVAGLGAFSFAPPSPATTGVVRATHLVQLRNAIDAAFSAIGLVPETWTDPSPGAGVTTIRAVHLRELRDSMR